MQIQLDEKGCIRAIAESGLANPIIYHGEIPDDFIENQGFYKLEEGRLVLDAYGLAAVQAAEDAQQEIAEIEAWFTWYDNQMMQHGRAQRRGEAFDRDIEELDAEARQKQLRIRELRGE